MELESFSFLSQKNEEPHIQRTMKFVGGDWKVSPAMKYVMLPEQTICGSTRLKRVSNYLKLNVLHKAFQVFFCILQMEEKS